MAVHGESKIAAKELAGNYLHSADDGPTRAELRLALGQLDEVLRCDFGVVLREEDLHLLGEAFPAEGDAAISGAEQRGQHLGQAVDGDLFVDALRGEVSPGRATALARLYEALQAEQGLGGREALHGEWLADRLHRAVPPQVPGAREPEFMPQTLVGVLQLRRTHTSISRAAFVRWMADVSFHLPGFDAFADCMGRIWGEALRVSARELRLWNLHIPAASLMPVRKLPWERLRPWDTLSNSTASSPEGSDNEEEDS